MHSDAYVARRASLSLSLLFLSLSLSLDLALSSSTSLDLDLTLSLSLSLVLPLSLILTLSLSLFSLPLSPLSLYFSLSLSLQGVTYSSTELPNAQKWSDATASGGAVVQKWRGGGRWFTDLCLVSEHDKSTKTLTFDDKIGCNQGGEGEVGGSQWWVENVKEELDDANEWWYVRVKRRSA